MKRIQSKLHRIGTWNFARSHCLVLMIKDVLNDGANTLTYFHKDIKD